MICIIKYNVQILLILMFIERFYFIERNRSINSEKTECECNWYDYPKQTKRNWFTPFYMILYSLDRTICLALNEVNRKKKL